MIDIKNIDFSKGLVPAIIIKQFTNQVLMLGYMNSEALELTINTNKVTFFSRSQNKIWVKGETSGNYLNLISIKADCDNDSLLIEVEPEGNTCHTGSYSCFENKEEANVNYLSYLFELIKKRKELLPENSYTTKLFNSGINRIVQKVGEEAIETVIAVKNDDKKEIINETSDLLYHLLVMLAEKNIDIREVVECLELRHKK